MTSNIVLGSVCQVIFSNKDEASGVFIAPNLVLSSGHVITKADSSEVLVTIASKNWKGEVIENEYNNDSSESPIDYSLIRIVEGFNFNCIELGTLGTELKVSVVVIGYPNSMAGTSRVESGELVQDPSKSMLTLNIKNSRQYKSLQDSHFFGLSGSPIISEYTGKLLGVQSSVNEKDHRFQICSIDAVYKRSSYLRKNTNYTKEGYSFYGKMNKVLLDNKIVKRSNRNEFVAERESLIFSTNKIVNTVDKLRDSIDDVLITSLNRTIASLYKNPSAYKLNDIHLSEIYEIFLDNNQNLYDVFKKMNDIDKNGLRILIDPTDISLKIDNDWIGFSQKSMSHIVNIVLSEDWEEDRILDNQNFPLSIGISTKYRSEEQLSKVIIGVYFDVFMDRYTYYHFNLFQIMFHGKLKENSFSQWKVKFAQHNNLRIYGHEIDNKSVLYTPFGALIRPDLDASLFSSSSYINLIEKFVTFLLESKFLESRFQVKRTISTIGEKNRLTKEEHLKNIFGSDKLGRVVEVDHKTLYGLRSCFHLIEIEDII